jgi:predicted Zn-dependent protease
LGATRQRSQRLRRFNRCGRNVKARHRPRARPARLHIQLAAIEAQAGQKDAAAADRKIAADLSRDAISRQRAGFALNSGRALLNQNKLDDAIVQFNNAAQADPTLIEPHNLLADAYTRQGKSADAALERQRALTIERQRASPDTRP